MLIQNGIIQMLWNPNRRPATLLDGQGLWKLWFKINRVSNKVIKPFKVLHSFQILKYYMFNIMKCLKQPQIVPRVIFGKANVLWPNWMLTQIATEKIIIMYLNLNLTSQKAITTDLKNFCLAININLEIVAIAIA